MKKIWFFLIVIIGCIAGFLFLSDNYYLRQALTHLTPKIDQYAIFENRIVKAESPKPWTLAEDYNQHSIPEIFLPTFNKLETVAYLIIKDSTLFFEQYWDDYSPSSHSNSFSMTKSIIALAIGCAIEDGYIKSADQPVSDFYPEFKGYNGKNLTIRHLLTMSAGVDFEEAYSSPFSPTTQLYYGNDLEKITFNMKMIEEPGINFVYQSGVTQLLNFILEKAVGENVSSYVSRKLWTPIHAEENAFWSLDKKDGMEKAYCCFNSNARDFARLGQLILNKGNLDGVQLVPQGYLEEALTPDTTLIYKEYNVPNKYYGFQFWILNYQGMQIPYMKGLLGQYVFIIPDMNVVVVRLGKKRSKTRTDQYFTDDIITWLDAAMEIIYQ